MNIKWRYFVPKIINIGLDLLELFEHNTGVQNFLRQCRLNVCTLTINNNTNAITPAIFVWTDSFFSYSSYGQIQKVIFCELLKLNFSQAGQNSAAETTMLNPETCQSIEG